jgi:hypothetical protein
MDLKCSHHIIASPQSYKVAMFVLRSLEQGWVKAENLASMALIHASASSGSSSLANIGGFIPINWV